MKKSEAFDSSLKKTFDECCEGEELKKEWEIEFEKFTLKGHGGWTEYPDMMEQTKSFISSLLAKQQEEFVKCLPEEKNKVIHPDDINFNEFYENRGYNACIADIKSKLNKEEPAYIGGVNLTTNDTEISSRLAVTDKNIGMLRQWLNEDRIDDFKKMITNDDIKFWLDIK
jgi:hypothetical protein